MVEDGEGGVILVGGQKQDNHYLDTLYHLKDAGFERKMETHDHPGSSTHPENSTHHDMPENHGPPPPNHPDDGAPHHPDDGTPHHPDNGTPNHIGNVIHWTLMPKTLKIARSFHTAFLIAGCPEIVPTTTADATTPQAVTATAPTTIDTTTTTTMDDETTTITA